MESAEAESQRRLDQFVDAAFGFAVTLLVIAGAQPPETLADLKLALLNLPASAAAFVLIALFWAAHRNLGKLMVRADGVTVVMSLAIVFTVLAYVYPLRLLTRSAFYWISGGRLPGEGLIRSLGDLATLYQVYGLGFALLSGLYAVLFARAARLAETPESREAAVEWRDPWIICAGAGVISVTVAFAPIARVPWLPPTMYSLIPFAIWARAAMRQRRLAKATA